MFNVGPDDPLYQAVLADPDSDALRLVYADYIDDHADGPGSAARAAFIRAQCELAPLPEGIYGRGRLRRTAAKLLYRYSQFWNGPLHRFLHRQPRRVSVDARHGMTRRWGSGPGFAESLPAPPLAFAFPRHGPFPP